LIQVNQEQYIARDVQYETDMLPLRQSIGTENVIPDILRMADQFSDLRVVFFASGEFALLRIHLEWPPPLPAVKPTARATGHALRWRGSSVPASNEQSARVPPQRVRMREFRGRHYLGQRKRRGTMAGPARMCRMPATT